MTETSREFLVHSDATIAVSAVLVCTPVGLDAPRESETQASIGVGSGDCGSQFHWHDRINCKVGAVTDCRRKLRHVYRFNTIDDSLEEMLREPKELDAVAVFGGAPYHFRRMRMCMGQRLRVTSAEPAPITFEKAEGLLMSRHEPARTT